MVWVHGRQTRCAGSRMVQWNPWLVANDEVSPETQKIRWWTSMGRIQWHEKATAKERHILYLDLVRSKLDPTTMFPHVGSRHPKLPEANSSLVPRRQALKALKLANRALRDAVKRKARGHNAWCVFVIYDIYVLYAFIPSGGWCVFKETSGKKCSIILIIGVIIIMQRLIWALWIHEQFGWICYHTPVANTMQKTTMHGHYLHDHGSGGFDLVAGHMWRMDTYIYIHRHIYIYIYIYRYIHRNTYVPTCVSGYR